MIERRKKVDRLAFLGSLAGGLAHEIKNPLSTIAVNLQLMKEDWEGHEGPKERRTLKRIEVLMQEIKRLGEVVNDFLEYARGFSLKLAPENINQVVNDLVLFVDPEARRQEIEIKTFMDPSLRPAAVDVKYLKLALLNVLHNAVEALAGWQGPREVLVRTRGLDDGVEVVITDTGAGIPREHASKIFQVYFSTKKGGTGMGLATVKRILEEHDGTVDFQSVEGKGTSFRFFLPYATSASARPEEGKDEK